MHFSILAWLAVGLVVLPTAGRARAPAAADSVRVLVVYHSLTGNTEQVAEAVAEGARRVPGAVVTVKPVADATNEDLDACDALLIGSPAYWGSMATPVKAFIDDQRPFMGDKVGGAFATGGSDGGGKELAVVTILAAMLNYGMIVVGPHYEEDGFRFGGFGVSVTTGVESPGVSESELQRARGLGERVASVAGRFRASE